MIKLTLADKKILSFIEFNPRITYKELAKECHLSKDTIKYRIARLEKETIILGYTIWVDYTKLGNQSYKIYCKINCSKEERNNLKEYLHNLKNIFAIFESQGNWNLAFALFAKNDLEFNSIENKILEKFGSVITYRSFCKMLSAEVYHQDFFNINKEKIDYKKMWDFNEEHFIDDIDRKIIKKLHENSRIALIKIAENINLSIDATKKRINNLKNKNIIRIEKTIINYKKLGYDHYKLLIFPKNFSNEIQNKIIDFLKSKKQCINTIKTIGSWKLEAEFLIKHTSEIENISNGIYENFKNYILDLEFAPIWNEEILNVNELLLR
ncbi:MAG: AsnC family transcriptional regulator [Nanobdellota archaeon]